MPDPEHTPKSELTTEQLEAREDCDEIKDQLREAQLHGRELITFPTCGLNRLENMGKVRDRKDYY